MFIILFYFKQIRKTIQGIIGFIISACRSDTGSFKSPANPVYIPDKASSTTRQSFAFKPRNSAAYSEEVGINTSYTNRHSVFPDNGIKEFSFNFPDSNGSYLIVHHIINRENGSAFDNFINMGAIEPLSPEETKYLINQTEPEIKKEKLPSLLTLNITLQPFEIRLIEISFLI